MPGQTAPLYTPVFGWTPPDESTAYVADTALRHMRDGGFKPARSSRWFMMRSVPVRITVVDPAPGRRSVSARRMRRWIHIAKTVTAAVDSISGPDPARPASIDITVYLWTGKKLLSPEHESITPRNANTGVTTRTLATGNTSILVYRSEEAVKTLIHEILHAYQFGDWANEDGDMVSRCHGMLRAEGLRLRSNKALKPTEALVDAMAIRMAAQLFGGRDWGECVRYAERLAARLVARAAARAGEWDQTTGAFEYYCVKPVFMRRMDEVMAAHLAGIQRPDRPKIRALLPPAGPVDIRSQEYSPPARAHRGLTGRTICLRMSPHRLAPSP